MNLNNIKSELRMKNLFFPKCSITRESNIKNEELQIDIKREIEEKSKSEYCVTVKLHIDKESKDLDVYIEAKADFLIENDDIDFVKGIINTNTVAIMFPFIRSQVSLITTQPNMNPIILPPINTTKIV